MSGDSGFDERDLPALRAAYRSLQSERSQECPKGEALAAFVVGDLEGQARERFADHIASCRSCSADYRVLLEVHALASKQIRVRHPRQMLWIAAAVCALAAAGALLFVRSARHEEVFRGAAGETAASVDPADGATLARAPLSLRWPPQREAEGYRIKLFASAGDALWETDAKNVDRIAVPEAVRSRLRSGQSFFWTVEVQMPLEKQRLGPFSFTIKR